MSQGIYDRLVSRVRHELMLLTETSRRCADIWTQYVETDDDRYIDGAALNLQSFYTGLERILEAILWEIDRFRPVGASWHRDLLDRAASPVPDLRSEIISRDLHAKLQPFRGFRHVSRHIYAVELDPEEVQPLVESLPALEQQISSELEQFAAVLEQSSEDDSGEAPGGNEGMFQ